MCYMINTRKHGFHWVNFNFLFTISNCEMQHRNNKRHLSHKVLCLTATKTGLLIYDWNWYFCQKLELATKLQCDLWDNGLGWEVPLDFKTGEINFLSFDRLNKSDATDIFKNDGVITFSSKLDCGSYIAYIANTSYGKIGPLMRLMKLCSCFSLSR